MIYQIARGFGLSLFLFSCIFLIGDASHSYAFAESDESPSLPAAPNLSELIRFVFIESSAEGYSNEKNWNKTSKRFDGLRIRGLRISKRKKAVKHGFCRKYAASLKNPEKNFEFTIEETTIPNEDVLAFLVNARLRARCEATFAHYVYGVKGINGTTVADADIRVKILISLNPQTEFSLSKPIPKFYLNTKVRDVDFRLKDVDVRKVGVLDGKFVEVVGDGLRKAFEELIQNQESRVKKKLQKELDKIQGKPTDQAS